MEGGAKGDSLRTGGIERDVSEFNALSSQVVVLRRRRAITIDRIVFPS